MRTASSPAGVHARRLVRAAAGLWRPGDQGTPDRAGTRAWNPARVTADGAALNELERQFSLVLRRARAGAGELSHEVHPDLDGSAYALLSNVAESSDGVRASAIAVLFGVDKGAISRQVTRLARVGLLERRIDPQDGRAMLLVATDEGRRRLGAAVAARRERFRARLEDWPEHDVAELARLLRRFNASLDRTPQPPSARSLDQLS